MTSKLLLLDGNSLTYRAFFALPQDMATVSGQLTNAVFGFTSMFIYVMKDQRPDQVLVAFDRPEPTFRHEADPTYKAQREAAPDPLRQQMGLVRQVLDVLGVPVCELAGFEADDLIATAAEQAVARGDEVVIVTGDRDAFQLVRDPHVRSVVQPTQAVVRKRMQAGVRENSWIDYAFLKTKAGKVVYSWTIAPPASSLAPGASAPFNSAEVNVPPGGEELTITLGAKAG